MAQPTWAGYPVRPDNYVDTTPWMGWVYVGSKPYIWVVNLGKYIYAPEEFISDSGGWTYIGK